VMPGCSSPSTSYAAFPGFPGSLPDGDASDGDHHYRKLCSEHVVGKFVRHVFKSFEHDCTTRELLRNGCISAKAGWIFHCGKTDGSSFICHRLGRAFRPLSKIASGHFFDASSSDRPNESGRLQYYDCRQDFYDGRRRCHFVPRIQPIRQKRVQRGHAAVTREGESNWNIKE
jgi:hypothetical protein